MKKFLLLPLAIILVSALMFSGCPAPAPPPPAPAPPPPAPAPPPTPEKFPERPVHLIVTWGAGGGGDITARKIATLLEPILGVPVPVENVPGATGAVGTAALIAKPTDGYYFSTFHSSTHAATVTGKIKAIAMFRDLEPLFRAQIMPNWIFSYPEVPWQNAEELMAYAKEHPGEVNICVSSKGSMEDIWVDMLKEKSGIELTAVAFPKPGERYASVVGGHNRLLFEQMGDVADYVEAGKLVPIIYLEKERHPDFPDVQTLDEIGLEALYFAKWRGYAVKAGTPPDRLKILADAMAKVNESKEWREFQKKMGADVELSFLGPEEFGAFLEETAKELEKTLEE